MSPPVSSCTPAVPRALQSPRCHGAGGSCQRCQRPWRGAALGCTEISHQSVIPGGQWHPAHPRAVPSLRHLHLHPQGSKARAAGGTHVPACTLVSLPPPQALSCPGCSSSWAGAGMGWGCSPEQGRGRRELGAPGEQAPAVDAAHGPHTPSRACRGGHCCASQLQGVFAAWLPPFALQILLCPSLPSCHPCNFFTARGGREGGTAWQREASPSVFNAPAAGAGQGGGLQVSSLQGVMG